MMGISSATAERVLVDTQKKIPETAVTNDGVMGGLSRGQVIVKDGKDERVLLFSGVLSLENQGGFSSWVILDEKVDLSMADGIKLSVKGDGRTYKMRLATDEKYRFSRVSFQAPFETRKGKWTDVLVSFSDLKASWRGRKLERPFEASKVSRVGIILADGKAGEFQLELKKMQAVQIQRKRSAAENLP